MSSSLVIKAADPSGRWYLLPGGANSYDVVVANESAHAVLCKLTLDEPADAGTVAPASLTLKAGESRTAHVAFKPEWLTLRDRKVVVTARDAGGNILATFVQDLVSATTTDCSISLAWKDEISGGGILRGFVLACTVRSISSTPGVFEPEFTPHPSLQFPGSKRIQLGPGEQTTFDVPITWNRSARDSEGWNHPRTIEAGVAVTHGRRSANAPWDLVQQHIEPYLSDADRAPVVARRPPPPQFTTPGGAAPTVSPMAVAAPPEPVDGETYSQRIARAELEAGVTAVASPPENAAAGDSRRATVPAPPRPDVIAVAPSTLLLIGLAISAIVVALFWMLRAPTGPTAVTTGPVVAPSAPLAIVKPHRTPARHPTKHLSSTPAAQAAATGGSSAENASGGTSPTNTTPAATTQPTTQSGGPARVGAAPQRVSPVDRGALVELNGVSAEYLRGGRVVHVFWDSYAQARAQVQVLNQRDVVVAQTTVGRSEAVVLTLPRGYHDGVYIQVTAFGYDGTRIVSTTSLGPP